MDKQKIIEQTAEHVKSRFLGEGSGHDWWHIFRVWTNAKNISRVEGGDKMVIELAALLHDIADWKFHDGDLSVGPKMGREWLENLNVQENVITDVCEIIETISFKGAGVATPMRTLEGKIVQDADRLDAIGAIGVARAFAYGGHKNREMYNPELKPERHDSFEEYKRNQGTTVNHFYEKLLLLKNMMNTQRGIEIAEQRHEYMEGFLAQFMEEWGNNQGYGE